MEQKTLNVLLVDDDAGYSNIIRELLTHNQETKFEVQWEKDSEKIIGFLKNNPQIKVILMDYYLPSMTGLDLAKRINEEQIDIPIIFLTANKDFRTAVEAMKQGAEEYLLKEEINDSILSRTIINVVERWQLKKKIADAEKQKLFIQKKTEAIKELVVTMCHEFNNLLAVIKISTAILTRQSLSDSEKQMLELFNTNVTLLEKQITKLRDLNLDQ